MTNVPNLSRTQPKSMPLSKGRPGRAICATVFIVIIFSFVGPTDSQQRSVAFEQITPPKAASNRADSNLEPIVVEEFFKASLSDEEPLTISESDQEGRPPPAIQKLEEQWSNRRVANQSIEPKTLSSTALAPSIIIQDQLPTPKLYRPDEPSDDNEIPSNILDHRPDPLPLPLFFSPAQPTAPSRPEDSFGATDSHRERTKRWLGARQVVSYPGTDTVYATKTVTVTPGQAQPTFPPGSPTVVVIVYVNDANYPQPTQSPSTVTLGKPGSSGPFTTTIYPPGVAVATVTVLSTANTKFDYSQTRSSIFTIVVFLSMSFSIGFLYLL
ncbi:hypothetical protein CROQUDRAFT_544290 [Cronartium quercuum f. sp. fusiforme G11]|uniref:Uncharacterized protein n=1 Tax=Cronartium quercuum f. sp. fusiforme G11 TaxID=708437 RepID=A0A9P6NXS4_9BASI|nr:hypothetical protein CROQUDRAFT_544290 [Cronartium quercuum f. sp. fusiforme G11]